MPDDKTHYRKAFNSPYLSSADIVEPTILTISHVKLLKDQTNKTKDSFNTAFFKEKEIRAGEELKPMILNAGNSRTMKLLTGSPYIDDWNDIAVTIYVDKNVRFGRDTVEGLRISTERPRVGKPQLTPESDRWSEAVAACRRDGNLDKVKRFVEISPENEALLVSEAENVA